MLSITDGAGIGALARATLGCVGHAALLCDEDAQLLVGNHASGDLLEQRDGVTLRGGRVHVAPPEQRARFQRMLTACDEGDHEATACGEHTAALLVPRPSGLPAYQIVLREVDTRDCSVGAQPHRLWTMIIADPARAPRAAIRTLSGLYGLTAAESRISAALVSGDTPDEIAAASGVKIATIRSQLASVFAKTGTRRQTELVRLFSAALSLG